MKVVKCLLELCTNWIWITNRQWSLSEGVDSPCIYLYSAGSLSEFLASFTSCCGQLRRRTVCSAFIHSVSIYSPHPHTRTRTLYVCVHLYLGDYHTNHPLPLSMPKPVQVDAMRAQPRQRKLSAFFTYLYIRTHTCIHTLNINTFITLRGGYSSRKYHSNQ